MSNKVCLIFCIILLSSTPVQLRRTCTRALDVVFLLNSGTDIPDDDWNLMTTLSRDVAYYLYPSTYGSHVAQVEFGGNASVIHGLNTQLVNSGRSESIQTGRNISDAIDTTRRLVLNNTDGDRPEVPDVIVLITHGLSDDKEDAIAEATRMKSEGIRIVCVGMTSTEVDDLREELREIATDPDDVDNLILINRNYYTPVFSGLLKAVCRNRVEAANESIRLVDGTSNTGRLEVYMQEEWVTVCANGWTDLNTGIACKQLGFQDGKSMYTMNQTFCHRRIGIANIQCTSNMTNLLQCSHDPFFHIDSSCDHQRDVFLRCLCSECNDYIPRDNIRLADRTPISGRLEIFSVGIPWGGVCSTGWTTSNTRVACRQLGFLDGAGTYQPNHRQSVSIAMFNVRCSGNENSLFDCAYSTTSTQRCSDPIYIRCECKHCPELLLHEPQQKDAMTQSTEVFEWRFKRNISAFEILFLSQKNPQTLVYVDEGKVIVENTRSQRRIQLINDDYSTVGFNLTNITAADMGIYSLYVPELLLSSKAILIVTDFGLVPDPVVHRQAHDSVKLSWDLTALRRLRDINYEIFLTTPASGRLHLDYCYTRWLRDNPGRHSVPPLADHLSPTIIIHDITVKDAGNYVIKLMLTSSVHQWLNSSWHLVTELVVTDTTSHRSNTAMSIVLGVSLGLSIIVIVVLTFYCRKLNNKIHRLKLLQKQKRRAPISRPRAPPRDAPHRDVSRPMTQDDRYDRPDSQEEFDESYENSEAEVTNIRG